MFKFHRLGMRFLISGLTALAFSGLRAEVVEIDSAAALAEAINGNPSGDYKLVGDIDCSSWVSLDFAGTLDGANHAVAGLKVPLFVNLSGTVENMTLDGSVGGVNTSIQIPDLADFGLLALTTTAARVEGVNVKGYSFVCDQPVSKTNPKNNIGFLAACAYDGSTFSQSMIMDGCSATVSGDLFLGGFVGTVYCSADFVGEAIVFSGCVNSAEFSSKNCSNSGNGAIGGILGREAAGYKSGSQRTLTFRNCVNNGSMTQTAANGNTTFGGIVGLYSSGSTSTRSTTLNLISCSNHGGYSNGANLGNNLRLGGMIGQGTTSAQSVLIDKCFNDGDFTPTASGTKGCGIGGFIGGLAAVAKYSTITIRNSVNCGELSAPINSSGTSAVGGAIGTVSGNKNYTGVEFHVENCSFIGGVSSERVGLVVAEFMSATSINGNLIFAVDNCWFGESGDLINTAADVEASASYLVTNLQFHSADADAEENAALSLVAAGNEDYSTWLVSGKSGHPEPVLGATMYTVIFKDWNDVVLSLQQVEEGAAAEAPVDPVRTGYSFAGWEPSDFSDVTGNMTIVATYEQSEDFRTVKFVDHEGRELAQITVELGTAVNDLAPQPTRTGHTLIGWTLDGEDFDLTTAVTDDITLVANYQINVYDVVFFDWSDNQLGETQKVAYLDAAVEPALPTPPAGMVFWKWSCDFSSVTENLEVRGAICDAEQTIWTAEDFAALINAETPSVVRFTLANDITLENWTGVDFSAVLDGRGHAIIGLTSPLFKTVTGATIENLVISNAVIATKETGEVIGLVACTAGDGTTISNVLTTSDCSVGVGINAVAGGLVGVMKNATGFEGDVCSWIVDCTNRAAVTKTDTDVNSSGSLAGIVGRIEALGVAGQPYVTNGILRCVNFGPVSCAHTGGHLAGLVGKASTGNDKALVALIDSVNYADLTGVTSYGSDAYKQLYAGGFIATVSSACYDVLIDGCVNRGNVSVGFEPDTQTSHFDKTASGMIAHVEALSKGAALTVRDSANYGDVVGERAAGIIGTVYANVNYSATKVHIFNCASYGAVSGRTAEALGVGVWTKPNVVFTRTMTNCFFRQDGDRELPVVIDAENGFSLEEVLTSGEDGFECKAARKRLAAWAVENGCARWVDGKVGEFVLPELEAFCLKTAAASMAVIFR